MGKVLAQYLIDLRLDLKDSGALWSNAELQRCIERAVADLSRFLPREKTLELTFDFTVKDEAFTTPAASDTDYYVTTWDISASVDGATATLVKTKPDVPRPVIITVTDANTSITALVVIVKGYDKDSKYQEEYFYLTGGLVQTGKRYFAAVSEVEIEKITGNGAADTLIVGTGTHLGVFVQLANKPIKFESETITSRTRNTDYIVDYIGGRIAMKSGGNMVAATAYTITTYDKSKITVDLQELVEDLIDIDRIEYPSGAVPQTHHKLERWGNLVTLAGGYKSQAEASDDEHLVINYHAAHTPPQTQASGSFPYFLDWTVQLASAAYALFMKALQYEHQAVTDLASSGTALGNIAAIHTLITTALAKVTTHATEADAALDKVATHAGTEADAALDKVTTHVTEADTALDKVAGIVGDAVGAGDANTALDAAATIVAVAGTVNTALAAGAAQFALAATALAKVATYLENNTNEDSKYWLTKITTDIATLRTLINSSIASSESKLNTAGPTSITAYLDNAGTALAAVATYLTNNASEDSKYWLTKITTDIANLRTAIQTALAAAKAYLDDVDVTDLGKATVGAEAYTESGDNYIDTINQGDNVPGLYADYSRARATIANSRMNAALGYIQEAVQRMSNLRSYIEQADGWGRIASGFVSEAVQRVAMAREVVNRENMYMSIAEGYTRAALGRLDNLRSYIEQAAGWGRVATGFVEEASQRTNAGNGYVAEATQRLGMAQAFIQEASQRIAMAGAYIQEASQRLGMAQAFIQESSQRIAMADAFISEASQRLGMAQAFIQEATQRNAQIDRYIGESAQYQAKATADLVLAEKFRVEATERRNEAWSIWRSPNQLAAISALGARRQPSD